jgi:hypothetical protein
MRWVVPAGAATGAAAADDPRVGCDASAAASPRIRGYTTAVLPLCAKQAPCMAGCPGRRARRAAAAAAAARAGASIWPAQQPRARGGRSYYGRCNRCCYKRLYYVYWRARSCVGRRPQEAATRHWRQCHCITRKAAGRVRGSVLPDSGAAALECRRRRGSAPRVGAPRIGLAWATTM